ncbi:MAG: fumarylacetoacetate hydrolase family protein [Pseudomonadota bacterium]
MPTNIARFEYESKAHWGVVKEAGVVPIPVDFATTGEFIAHTTTETLSQLSGDAIPLEQITLLSPVTRNQQFVCQGANYRQHMIESGVDPDAKHFNMIFTKAQSCIVPADSPVIIPEGIRLLDYEIELGLVLRRSIHAPVDLNEDTLHEYIAGLVVVNDYSARDVQLPQVQFYKGKSFRTFGPVGPWLCLLEEHELKHIHNLQLTLKVDGEVRQNDNTENLVFGPVATLNELSRIQDLEVGDLIATGTPAGCALSVPSPRKQKIAAVLPEAKKWELFMNSQLKRTQYLKPGQVVSSHVRSPDGVIDLGEQRNRVIQG